MAPCRIPVETHAKLSRSSVARSGEHDLPCRACREARREGVLAHSCRHVTRPARAIRDSAAFGRYVRLDFAVVRGALRTTKMPSSDQSLYSARGDSNRRCVSVSRPEWRMPHSAQISSRPPAQCHCCDTEIHPGEDRCSRCGFYFHGRPWRIKALDLALSTVPWLILGATLFFIAYLALTWVAAIGGAAFVM